MIRYARDILSIKANDTGRRIAIRIRPLCRFHAHFPQIGFQRPNRGSRDAIADACAGDVGGCPRQVRLVLPLVERCGQANDRMDAPRPEEYRIWTRRYVFWQPLPNLNLRK